MKFKLINGSEITLNISKSKHPIKDFDNKISKFQYDLGQVLTDKYPNYPILEEFSIPQEAIYLDFFIPKLNLVFEAHGAQHYNFIPHFHQHKHIFIHAQSKDFQKEEWCKLNDITMIVVPYTENTPEKIRNSIDISLE